MGGRRNPEHRIKGNVFYPIFSLLIDREMTVHRIQIMASTDVESQNVRNKVADLKTKYGEKIAKENAPFDLGESDEGTAYYEGTFIVTLTESSKSSEKTDLMDQIRKEMDKSSSWWQIRWHECTHDGTEREVERTRELPDGTTETYTTTIKGCGWENVQKSNSNDIPDEVEY